MARIKEIDTALQELIATPDVIEVLKEARHMILHLMDDWDESGHSNDDVERIITQIEALTGGNTNGTN